MKFILPTATRHFANARKAVTATGEAIYFNGRRVGRCVDPINRDNAAAIRNAAAKLTAARAGRR